MPMDLLFCCPQDIIGDNPGLRLLAEVLILMGLSSGNVACNDTALSTSE